MENFTTHQSISQAVIEEKLAHGYNLDISSYLSNGWNIFKKEWLTFSLYSLIVLLIVSTVIGAIVLLPLTLGFYIGADRVAKGQSLSISDMFAGFNHRLGSLIVLTLVPVIIMLLVYLPLIGVMAGQGTTGADAEAVGMASTGLMLLFNLLIFVAAIVLNLAMFFAPYLVFFGDYTVMEAIKTSWKLSLKNVLMIFVYILLIGIITQVGIFLCFVGIFASMALAYVCYYPLIKDVLFKEKVNVAG